MKEQHELESKLQELDRELEADSFSFPGRVWTLGARCAVLYVLGRLESLDLARESDTAWTGPLSLSIKPVYCSESAQLRLERALLRGLLPR